ncbi:MAG: MmgE/PrpD family protein [Desulfobacteraceae bacterium]|nr:MmgE/PrpD family protein [Desulfobacteraceae bacterium]
MSTQEVAEFVSGIRFEKLPKDVVNQAKKAIGDIICVSIPAHVDEAVRAVRKFVSARSGIGESSLIGLQGKYPAESAALVNSMMASTLDMDDGAMGLSSHDRFHRGHPGGIVVPAALAVAEKTGANGSQLIEAVIAGYEVAFLKARLIGKTVLAGETGTVGAAAAAARLLGLNPLEICETFNIASAHCPAPSYAFIWTQMGMTKEAAAWGAMTGVTAALLAHCGFRGTPSFFDRPELEKIPVASLGRDWEILSLYFKQYSACRHAHASIDGVLDLMDKHRLAPDDIAEIIIGCAARKGLQMSNTRPATIWQAQYSIPFAIGMAVQERQVGPDQVSRDRLGDRAVLAVADRVRLIADPDVEALQPGTLSARMVIRTRDGKRHETFAGHPTGDPENPLTNEQWEHKFRSLSRRVISPDKTEALLDLVNGLENVKHIDQLMANLRNFQTTP